MRKAETLEKIITRPMNLATVLDYEIGRGSVMARALGWGFKKTVFLISNGFMCEYRSVAEMEKFRDMLIQYFYDWIKAENLLKDFKRNYTKMIKLAKRSSIILNSERLDTKEIIDLVVNFARYNQKMWVSAGLIYWLPIWIQKETCNKEQGEHLNEIIKARYSGHKEYVLSMIFYDNIISFITKNISDVDNLEYCTSSELIKVIKNKKIDKIFWEKLIKRKKCCLIFKERIYLTSNVNTFLAKFRLKVPKEKKVKKVIIFKGQVAYVGKVRGRVKLLFTKLDMTKVKNGDIIVSPMTTPYFEPILNKVRAIITDEGGITCHAAIISRELKKPCIIGTKIATKVLKDGDLVEVDANRGIVKIIKRK
ncbi:MAG: PEP-utilizing enzyme [Patescibacteria group bacterium]